VRAFAAPWTAALSVAGALAAGVYTVSVLDRLTAAWTSGRHTRLKDVFVGPVRAAAFLFVQQRSSTDTV